jgi:Mu transposase-like protein
MVRDEQVRLLRTKMDDGDKQQTAAAQAGMSVRTARKWQRGALPSESKQERHWRTRADPFAGVWKSDIVPLLAADERGALEAATLIELLQERHPGDFLDGQVRTLQRRLRDWRAEHGPALTVKFQQTHEPGREASIDFTHADDLGVTIAGEVFEHLLFHFVLSFSGWTWLGLAFAETYEALVAGVQGALWELGGAPRVLRSDNLSAATHELRDGGRSLTKRFKAVLDHYGMTSTRIRPGESHENGVAEKAHHLIKSALDQALVIRGSRDFATVDQYVAFARRVVDTKRNRGIELDLAEERRHFAALPSAPVPGFTTYRPRVSCWSTVAVGTRLYSVPSRLIGYEVEVRQHPDIVEVRYRGKTIETMPRIRGEKDHRIDYRHVIWSLVKKPGAFTRYRYREELFPSMVFRRAYDALRGFGDRADVEYVRILHLAASTYQATVERTLEVLLASTERFDYAAVKALAQPERPAIPQLAALVPDLASYDRLLVGGAS